MEAAPRAGRRKNGRILDGFSMDFDGFFGDSSNFTQKTWEEFDDLTKTNRNLTQ